MSRLSEIMQREGVTDIAFNCVMDIAWLQNTYDNLSTLIDVDVIMLFLMMECAMSKGREVTMTARINSNGKPANSTFIGYDY